MPPPLAVAAAACLLLGVASLALPSGPTYDPYSWLIWGREIAHLRLTLDGTGTSWKPLPAFVDALLTPLGGGAADGWLAIARAGALYAGCVAFALAWRLAPAQKWLAGGAAAASVALTAHWMNRNGVGGAEGLMVAFGLLAVVRHLDGRREQAFWLVVLASLIRVEMWPFAFAYGAWLWWSGGRRGAIALGWAVIPLLWFGGDWVGSGNLTTAAGLAHRAVHGSLATAPNPAAAVLHEAGGMLPLPAWIAIAVALAVAVLRRDATAVWLGGWAAAWTALVVVMTMHGYPGEDRFLYMATGLESVLAGVGCATVAARIGRPQILAAAAVAAAFALGAVAQARRIPADVAAIDKIADVDATLVQRVRRDGGATAILHCGQPHTTWYTVTALAYDLDVPASDVHSGARRVELPPEPCQAAEAHRRNRS